MRPWGLIYIGKLDQGGLLFVLGFFSDERGPWKSDTDSFCSLLGQEEGYKKPKGTKYACEGIFLWLMVGHT